MNLLPLLPKLTRTGSNCRWPTNCYTPIPLPRHFGIRRWQQGRGFACSKGRTVNIVSLAHHIIAGLLLGACFEAWLRLGRLQHMRRTGDDGDD
jgi:hypothetical protein